MSSLDELKRKYKVGHYYEHAGTIFKITGFKDNGGHDDGVCAIIVYDSKISSVIGKHTSWNIGKHTSWNIACEKCKEVSEDYVMARKI